MKSSKLPAMACLMFSVFLLSGCETMQSISMPSISIPGFKTAAHPRQSIPYDSMPLEAAAITSAVAIQTLTQPLAQIGNVRFAQGSGGLSEVDLAVEGFVFTAAELQAFRPAASGQTGLAGGYISYTCPLDRRAEFAFLAEYEKNGEELLVQSLKVTPRYATAPRVKVFVLRAADLTDDRTMATYGDVVALVADKALNPGYLSKSQEAVDVVVLAVGEDRVAPSSELGLVVSDTSTGTTGLGQGSIRHSFNGWPVVVLTGTVDLSAAKGPLYAKVNFHQAGLGGMIRTSLLCSHLLTNGAR